MNIKILVAYHKDWNFIENEIFLPIHVGKANSKKIFPIMGDNTGDNISSKNPIYCELTATYWAWKNLKADYVGLCHYRRFFCLKEAPILHRINNILRYWSYLLLGNILKPGVNFDLFQHIKTNSKEYFKELALDFSNKIPSIIEKGKIDVVYQHPYKGVNLTTRRRYNEIGRFNVELLDEIVKNNFSDFYPYLCKTLDSTILYSCNMMIMRYDYFLDYCNTMFSILKLHEERVLQEKWCLDLLNEKCYSRVSGYLAEIITSAYIVKMQSEGKRTLEVDSVFLDL